jgi:mono/diheme cytochrome c family protein
MNRLVLAASFAAAIGFAGAAQAQDAPAGNADNGKRIYMADGCYFCHGRDGQGGAFNGPAPILANTALPFDAFKTQLRTPSADMPPYAEEVLADAGLADVYAFLHTLPGPTDPKDVAILNH